MGGEEKRAIDEHDRDDSEMSARGFNRTEHQTGRDPRKSLMPNVLHRSLTEDSFGMGAGLESQVQNNGKNIYLISKG